MDEQDLLRKLEALERRVDDAEQKVRELTERPQKATLGSKANPLRLVYLGDDRTGAVAEVRYDRDNAGLRTNEVR